MSNPPAAFDYAHSTYLSITFPPSSPFYNAPTSLSASSPSSADSTPQPGLTYVSPVGELPDSHIYAVQGVAGSEWERVKDQVLGGVKGTQGVGRVEVLQPKVRAKRAGGEL